MDCHSCGHTNRPAARFCGACAEPLGAAVRCGGCGESNPAGQRFCDACGARLEATARAPGPPTRVDGRYEVLRFLGEGGRKQVYLAWDSRLEREVALSLLKMEGIDQLGLARARREGEAMGRLGDHPHIVTIFDIGEEDGRLYIVSQYMAGGDLQGLIRDAEGHRLAPDEVMRIGGQIAQALEHAHAHGIVHRDIKPQNVWLTEEGVAKLGDFGLAVSADRSRITEEGMMLGTVAYMAPEQALGGAVDARADLYSLGTVLYALLCGRPPFVGDDAVAIVSQHVNTPPVAPSWHTAGIPAPLDALVTRLLAKAPADRPQSAAEVREALEGMAAAAAGRDAPAAPAPERRAAGRFVGREREIAELRAAFDSALAGNGRLTMLAGDAGIGKTRLAEELAAYAGLRGAQVLWGRCHEVAGAPAYWPWIQVIRAYAHEQDPDVLASELGPGAPEVAALVSDLRERLPGLSEPPSLDPEQARFRLFDSISTFLRNASTRAPLVIVLDDLHAADKLSVLLLEFLQLDLRRARIFVVGTYRDAELDRAHVLTETLAALRRERGYEHLVLRGLAPGEVKTMLEDMAGHELTGSDEVALVEALHRETDGNPYFAEEVVRHLFETGGLHEADGRWVPAAAPDELGVPQGVRDVIGRRLRGLAPECAEALAVAAVLGREFRVDVLERMSELSGDALLDCLEEAVAAGVVEELSGRPGRYSFRHAIVRDTLYDDLGTRRRRALHHRAGVALEELHADELEQHLGALAHHFLEAAQSGDEGKAVDYAERAARRAAEHLMYDDAAAHLEHALRFLGGGQADPGQRCELLLDLGDMQWRAGDIPRARETFQRAAEIARQRGRPEDLARAALGYGTGLGGFGVSEHADEALIGLLHEALDALPPGDGELRVRAMARLGVELYYSDRVAERERLCAEAVAMAGRLGDPQLQLIALYSRHWSSLGPDGLHRQPEVAAKLLALSQRVGDREMEFRGRHFRINTLLQLGDVEGADVEIAACERLAAELRQPLYRWQTSVFRVMRALMEGDLAEAERLAGEGLAMGRRGHEQMALVVVGAQFFFIRWARGGLEDLVEGAREFARRYPLSPWPCSLAFLYSELGRREDARAAFDDVARDDFGALRREGEWIGGLALCSLACGYLHDVERARVLYRLLVPYGERYATLIAGALSVGHVSLYLGVLAATAGDWERAFAHFERAIERNGRIGAAPLVALSRTYYAEALFGTGEIDRALELANAGLEEARELGFKPCVERLIELRLRAQGVSGAATQTSIDAVASSVETTRPDLSSAASRDGTVTIVFSDIEDSTALTERLGDRRWLELVRAHNALVRRLVREHRGFEVKSQGDGFMLAFPGAPQALRCSIAIQRQIAAHPELRAGEPIRVRIGLHTGEALHAEQDFYGKNVNLAARVADCAQGGEILVSSSFRELVEGAGEFHFGEPRRVELRGIAGAHELVPVEWQRTEDDVTTSPGLRARS